jgi:ParB-like chromosome segregation protein Spo0J
MQITAGLEFHPIANIFPLLPEKELAELTESIRQHGLQEPIILFEGQILDGRNRYRACEGARVEPQIIEWEPNGISALDYVITRNLHRRHLDEAQRAIVAGRIANMRQGERTDLEHSANWQKVSIPRAAEMLNVSERSVARAREVLDKGTPELISAVEQGSMSVSAAADFTDLPQEIQREAVHQIVSGEKTAPEVKRDLSVHFSSATPEWYTPPEIVERVIKLFGKIDLDPCSNLEKNIPAKLYYDKTSDGLVQPWHGRIYMNPPYGREIVAWAEKFVAEYDSGRMTEGIALVPARVDTDWFRLLRDCAWCAIDGRLKFSGHTNSAPFPSAVIYAGNRRREFFEAFSDMGDVWERYSR